MAAKQGAKQSRIKVDVIPLERYLEAPIVPWGHGSEEGEDSYIAPELCESSDLPISQVDDLLRAANRVLLRELLAQGKASVMCAENSNPYFDISINLEGEHGTELGFWEMYECAYRPIWEWWPEFSREVVCDYSEEDESDDLVEYSVTVSPWNDPMDYSVTAPACAQEIVAAAQERRSPNGFGAADVILALVAAHPHTPSDVLRELALDPDETVRFAVQGNVAASDEIRALAGLSGPNQ